MSLPRPPATLLRTPLMNQAKKHMAFAMVLGVATGIAYKVFVTDPRKRAYTKFHQLVYYSFTIGNNFTINFFSL